MKKIITFLVASIFVVSAFATPALQETYNGIKAYQAGNYKEALRLLTKASNAGNINASGVLSQMYYNGQGVQQDYKKGFKLIKLSATKEYPESIYDLGLYYYFGNGVGKNERKAIQLYTEAANLGSTSAQNKLGAQYASGAAVTQNYPEAYMWYNLAWINGLSDKNNVKGTFIQPVLAKAPYCISLGQDNVSQAYMNGVGGLKKSQSEALEWMDKAQETDPTLSIVNLDLAKMYALNDDKDKAFEFAQKAVTQPYAPAMQYLGTMYQKGIGTSKDLVKAYAYLSLAENLYKNPDDKFFSTFAAPCMPNYKQTTKEFNVDVTLTQLNELHLSGQAVAKADVIMKKVKEGWKK